MFRMPFPTDEQLLGVDSIRLIPHNHMSSEL